MDSLENQIASLVRSSQRRKRVVNLNAVKNLHLEIRQWKILTSWREHCECASQAAT